MPPKNTKAGNQSVLTGYNLLTLRDDYGVNFSWGQVRGIRFQHGFQNKFM